MKKVMMLLGVLFLLAAPGMAQNVKTNDAGVQNIIKRAVAKAAMEASEEWKWEEFLGLAQIDRSLIANYPYSDFLCYENDTRTFIALTYRDQMEEYYQGAGEVKWFKVGEVPQYRRFDPRTGWEQLAGVGGVEQLLKDGKCIKLEDFKSAIPLAERKAKIERMKQMKQQEQEWELAKQPERAHKAMLLSLSMANGQGVPLKVAEQLVLGFGITNLPSPKNWSKVYYDPAKKIIWLSYHKLEGRGQWTCPASVTQPLKVVLDMDNGKYSIREGQSFDASYDDSDKYNSPDNIDDYMLVYDGVRGVVGSIAKSLDPVSKISDQYKKLKIATNMLLEEINKE